MKPGRASGNAVENGRTDVLCRNVIDKQQQPGAQGLARGLNVHVVSISQEQAQEHYGFLGFFAGRDARTSSAQTRAKFGWNPTGHDLLIDLGNMRYTQV